jgi:serine/threonine protein kinase
LIIFLRFGVEQVAIKILEKDKIKDTADIERVSREIHILKIIRHPHIIQLYEVTFFPGFLKAHFSQTDYRNKPATFFGHGICKRRRVV